MGDLNYFSILCFVWALIGIGSRHLNIKQKFCTKPTYFITFCALSEAKGMDIKMINGASNLFSNSTYSNNYREKEGTKKIDFRKSLLEETAKKAMKSNIERDNYVKGPSNESYEKISQYEKSIQIKDEKVGTEFVNVLEEDNENETDTDTNIIVKPDGSRVLVITTKIGGMESTRSIELSKPNEWNQTNSTEESQENNNIKSDEMLDVSETTCDR